MNEEEVEPFGKAEAVKLLWEFACEPPEANRGSLTNQVKACKMLWTTHRYAPALRRLSDLAAIAPSRTKGKSRSQKSAQKLLTSFLKAVKPDKNQQTQ